MLASLGITAGRVREQVIRTVNTANQVSSQQIPFTPHAKRVLELALREGLRLGTNQIATEHILLGLLGEEDGGAVGILVESETIRAQLVSRLVDLRSEPGLDTRPGRATRHPVDQSWFGALGAHVNMLAKEIRRDLERDPDPGDLPIALARAPNTLVAAALRELGVDHPPLRIGVALLDLFASVAEAWPLLVVVDDVQWIDGASAAALLFAARRLGAEGVAMLIATRGIAVRMLDLGGLDGVALDGIDLDSLGCWSSR